MLITSEGNLRVDWVRLKGRSDEHVVLVSDLFLFCDGAIVSHGIGVDALAMHLKELAQWA